jgi:parallel beta-helix repeat protein
MEGDVMKSNLWVKVFDRWFRDRSRTHSTALPLRIRLELEHLETRELLSGPGTFYVHPGESIQATVDAAPAGSTIFIEPGTYTEAINVAKPGLHLIGLVGPGGSEPLIENPGTADTGITVAGPTPGSTLNGFILENLVVRDFLENGVLLAGVDHFVISGVQAVHNGEYGLFPVFSAFGLISNCMAQGSNDTGIYIGQSKHIVLNHNLVFDNVNGLEIENSSFVIAEGNVSRDNTVGILEDLLPGLTIETSAFNLVANNIVVHNNRPNIASAGDLAAAEPSGIGILLVGGAYNATIGNFVSQNGYIGIVLISGVTLIELAGLDPGAYSSIDPNPEHTLIANNLVKGNGMHFSYAGLPPGADLLWDGTGTDNHWRHNLFDTSFPLLLP